MRKIFSSSDTQRPFSLEKIARAIKGEQYIKSLLSKKSQFLVQRREFIDLKPISNSNKAMLGNFSYASEKDLPNVENFSFHPKLSHAQVPKERPYYKLIKHLEENKDPSQLKVNEDYFEGFNSFKRRMNMRTFIEGSKANLGSVKDYNIKDLNSFEYKLVNQNQGDGMFLTNVKEQNTQTVKDDSKIEDYSSIIPELKEKMRPSIKKEIKINNSIYERDREILEKNNNISVNCVLSAAHPYLPKKVFYPEKFVYSLANFQDDETYQRIKGMDETLKKILNGEE